MAPGNITTIIIIVSALAALLIVFLLIKKLIKSFLAIILITVIGIGCFIGIKAIDEKTNIRNKIAVIDRQLQAIQDNNSDIKAIQCNHLGTDIGINVIVTIDTESNEALTQDTLHQIRAVLLLKSNFEQICNMYDEYGIPNQIMVGIKYKGLNIQYHHATLTDKSGSIAEHPNTMYSDFIIDFNTGAIGNPATATN